MAYFVLMCYSHSISSLNDFTYTIIIIIIIIAITIPSRLCNTY